MDRSNINNAFLSWNSATIKCNHTINILILKGEMVLEMTHDRLTTLQIFHVKPPRVSCHKAWIRLHCSHFTEFRAFYHRSVGNMLEADLSIPCFYSAYYSGDFHSGDESPFTSTTGKSSRFTLVTFQRLHSQAFSLSLHYNTETHKLDQRLSVQTLNV